jgi:hypothetical protein
MPRRRCVMRLLQEPRSQAKQTWARSHPRISGLIGVGAVVVGINMLHTFGPIHLHNDGPLGSLSGASFAFASSTSGPWTAGYELCLQPGAGPVIIESISPASEVGGGLNYLGAYVREMTPDTSVATSTGGIGDVQGFPPNATQTLHPVAGYRVTHECSWEGAQSATYGSSPHTELDVGIGRRAPAAGGGWTGFTVTYSVGSTQYVVTWDTRLYACATGAPLSAGCTPPT